MSMTPACAKPHTPVDRRQDPRGDPGCGPVLAAAGGHGGRPPEDGVEQLLGRPERQHRLNREVAVGCADRCRCGEVDSQHGQHERDDGAGERRDGADYGEHCHVRPEHCPQRRRAGNVGRRNDGHPTTVRDKILAAWAQLYDGLNGSSGSTARLMTEVGNRFGRSEVDGEHSEHERDDGTVDGLRRSVGDLGDQHRPVWGTSAGSTILPAALPTKLQTVGSGFVMRKTSGTISVSCSANTATAIKFPTSAYDSTASNTGDYTLSTGGSGELKVSAANAGWYMVEVAFGADQNARAVGYRLSAAMFLNGSLHKIGSTVDYYGSLSTQFPFCAQASFIVYLSASDYITRARCCTASRRSAAFR